MKEKLGFPNLLKRTIAVISTSFTSLVNHTHATEQIIQEFDGKDVNIEGFQKKVLKSKLVLKLNSSNINEGKVVMHTSHSSHSSHASHSSHYSSSPSYTPSYTPSYKPVSPGYNDNGNGTLTTQTQQLKTSTNNTGKKSLPYYFLGSRTLFKGCRGTDVKELQQLLIGLGYDIEANGYFGETTKTAVIDFQNSNLLTADGKVGPQTLTAIQSK